MGIQQENKQIRELQQENKGKVFGLLWGLAGAVTNLRGLEVAQWLRALEHQVQFLAAQSCLSFHLKDATPSLGSRGTCVVRRHMCRY